MSRVGNVGNTSIQLDGQVKQRQRKGDLIFEKDVVNEKKLTTGVDVTNKTTAATTFSVKTTTTPKTLTNGKIRISMGRSMKDGKWKWTRSKKNHPSNAFVANDSQMKKATTQLSSSRQNIKKLCKAYRGLAHSLKLYKLHG